jgi:uncharacterized membrane protein (DUF485 family)
MSGALGLWRAAGKGGDAAAIAIASASASGDNRHGSGRCSMQKSGAGIAAAEAGLQKIVQDERYMQLLQSRSRFAWLLTLIMLIIFFGYILTIAFRRDLLARSIGGGVTSLGIPVGISVILAGILLTGIYVWRANRDFDVLVDALKRDYPQ